MKKIGILFGMENTFPQAFVNKVNSMAVDGITAEFVDIGTVKEAVSWRVFRDCRSHLA